MPPLMVKGCLGVTHPCLPFLTKGRCHGVTKGIRKSAFDTANRTTNRQSLSQLRCQLPLHKGGLLGWYSPFAQGSHNGKRHMSVRRNPQNPARKQGNPFFPKSHIFLLFPKMAAAGERRPQFIGVFLPAKGRPPAESAFSAPYDKSRKSAPCLCFSETVQKIPRKSGGIFSE